MGICNMVVFPVADGHIASEMSLGEAVVRGILPAPRYVTTIYQYQQGLERWEQRIRSMRSRRQREKSEQYLQALRRTMEQADGLDEVFHKHMTDRSGRYIVFCSGVQHMKDMQARAGEWFGKIDPQPHCYFVSAESAESPEEYEAFRRDESDHLKLLFCVNMLNEGVHVDGVSGVILFRPTVSPIIYKQQIGRALTAGKRHEPLILDVVNNIESLYSIGTIQQEMDEAIHRLRGNGQGDLIVQERFRVIDQVQSCRALFEQMEESLHIDWEDYFQAAVSCREEHGDLLIPQRYVTDDGKCLGAWLNSQRNIHNGSKAGKLTPVQVQRLEQLGMVWGQLADESWEQHFHEAEHYLQQHGDLNIPGSYVDRTGFALGQWLARLHCAHKSSTSHPELTDEQIAQLDAIGMNWTDVRHDRWMQWYDAACAYYQKNGDLSVRKDYVTEDGQALGVWLVNQRMNRKRFEGTSHAMPAERIHLLDKLGMKW